MPADNLIARAVRVDAHPYPMHLSFLDVAIVFALHCFDDKNRLGLVEEREENNRYRRPPRGGALGLLASFYSSYFPKRIMLV